MAADDVLVDTDWVAERLDQIHDSGDYTLVEVDVDTDNYHDAHIPGAVLWDWEEDLCDTTCRDVAPRERFERLMEQSGVSNDTTVILYGDRNNWFAAYAFWLLRYYGHDDVVLMDGGRAKWQAEDREMATEAPSPDAASYTAADPDESLRAYRGEVRQAISDAEDTELVDVRSPEEFTGEVIAPPGMSETAQRGGHVPGAVNVPWVTAVAEDGTFKSPEELREIYSDVADADRVIAYCRIGERAAHTWFALKYLVGIDDVQNYDGSWTEWGSLIGAPIETGR